MYTMGVELIRLYDWDARNNRQKFLDQCQQAGIGVLVSVSIMTLARPGLATYERGDTGAYQVFFERHRLSPAVQGVVIGNEYNRQDNIKYG